MTFESDDGNLCKRVGENGRERRVFTGVVVRGSCRVSGNQSDGIATDSRTFNGFTDGLRRAQTLRVRLREVMGVGGFSVAKDLCDRFHPALLGIQMTFQNDDAISLGELHAATISCEGSERAISNESQAVEASVCIFTDGVVAAGDDQIELATSKHRDSLDDRAA